MIDAVTSAPVIAELAVKPPIANQATTPPSNPIKDNLTQFNERTNEQEADSAARSLEEVLTGYNISLKFSRDDQTGTTVVQLVNKAGETLRQFPSEVSLHLTAMFGKLQGRLFNRQA